MFELRFALNWRVDLRIFQNLTTMKSFIFMSAVLAAVQAQLQINTPVGVTQCQPSLITWQAGTPPYFLTVLPGGQPGAAPLKTFPQTSDTSLTWNVDLAGGTPISLALKDQSGAQVFSAQVTIGQSADSSCVNSNAAPNPVAGVPSVSGQLPVPTTPAGTTPLLSTSAGFITSGITPTPSLSSPSLTAATISTTSRSGSIAGYRANIGAFFLAGAFAFAGAVLF